MKVIDLAVVIPTLNEEDYIGTLLDSIFNQTVWPKEIAVVDAQSPDRTAEEVTKRQKILPQLQFYQIPKQTISKQRNFGAEQTKSKHILFLDADMKLEEKNTLEKYLTEVEKKRPDVAAATNLPLSASWKDQLFFLNMNLWMKMVKPFWPWTTGMNIYITRSGFDKVKGFDEKVRVAEDIELVQRMVKMGFRFIFLDDPKIYTSVRRFVKEGRRGFVWKAIKGFFKIKINGFRDSNIEYEFGKFHGDLQAQEKLFEKMIHKMEENRFTQAILKIIKIKNS